MDLILKFLRLEWWVYLIVAVTFFSIALFLNYVVKRVNEARLEERFNQMSTIVSNNQSVQVHRRIETNTKSRLRPRVPLEIVIEQSNPPTVTGGSLSQDKEDIAKDRIDIKNFPRLTTADVVDATENEVTTKQSDNEITQPTYLGKIYKEINIIERSKSLSNADRDAVPEITNNIDCKKQESQSTPSVKKMLDNQNRTTEDIKKLFE